ncbi:hypothetical protein BHM03_00057964 [Ensete ventricosum]|nr:hypothetical protein BHM03_00057964 [Ensete ventricosum]
MAKENNRDKLAWQLAVGSDEEEVPSTSFTTEEAKERCGSSRQRRLQQRHECDGNVALVTLDSEVEKSGGEAAYSVCSAEGEVEGVVQVRWAPAVGHRRWKKALESRRPHLLHELGDSESGMRGALGRSCVQ